MARATIVLHGDLADFLPVGRRGAEMHRSFAGRPAVKDLLEAVGVPHPEIAAIEVDGIAAGFGHPVADGDRVEAWPAGEAAARGLAPLTPSPVAGPGDPRFVVDGHLGRLAAYLRMLGFDTWYRNDARDDQLATVAADERRILLTRDRGLLRRSVVSWGAYVRSDRPVEQLVEVVRRFGLADRWQPFGRCIRCNAGLLAATREEVLDRLEPLTRIYFDDFRRCPGCDAVYWKGSHHARMARLIERVRGEAGPAAP